MSALSGQFADATNVNSQNLLVSFDMRVPHRYFSLCKWSDFMPLLWKDFDALNVDVTGCWWLTSCECSDGVHSHICLSMTHDNLCQLCVCRIGRACWIKPKQIWLHYSTLILVHIKCFASHLHVRRSRSEVSEKFPRHNYDLAWMRPVMPPILCRWGTFGAEGYKHSMWWFLQILHPGLRGCGLHCYGLGDGTKGSPLSGMVHIWMAIFWS